MSTEPTGLAGALADVAGDSVPDVEPEMTFFPPVDVVDALPRGRGKLQREDLRNLRRHGERGRPPGSRNRRNVKYAAYFVAKYGDPLAVLGEIMSRPIDVLIEEMEAAQGGDAKHKPVRAIDALRLKIDAATQAAPYIHGKQPVSIEVSERKDMVLLVPGLNVHSDQDAETIRAAIEEHGLAAVDPETQELVLLPTNRRVEDIPDADDDDGRDGDDA